MYTFKYKFCKKSSAGEDSCLKGEGCHFPKLIRRVLPFSIKNAPKFQHGPYDVQKTRRLAGQENDFLAYFPQKKTPSFILSYKKRHQIGLSFLSQAATYRPVSSNWSFFFSQAVACRPVLYQI